MMTWGWIDLLSCIPTFGWGRIARIIRILKILKAIHSGLELLKAIGQRRTESALLTATIIMIFAILFGSVAILLCEVDAPGATISNAPDAIWWAFCMVIKGHCDGYKSVTIEGRAVTAVLLILGKAVSATVIGFVAVFLVSGGKRRDSDSGSLTENSNDK